MSHWRQECAVLRRKKSERWKKKNNSIRRDLGKFELVEVIRQQGLVGEEKTGRQ